MRHKSKHKAMPPQLAKKAVFSAQDPSIVNTFNRIDTLNKKGADGKIIVMNF